MGIKYSKLKHGTGNCNATGSIVEVELSAMDNPSGIDIVQINCDELNCTHEECCYKDKELIGCIKDYLDLQSIRWN